MEICRYNWFRMKRKAQNLGQGTYTELIKKGEINKPDCVIMSKKGVTDAILYRYMGILRVIYGLLYEHAHDPNEYVNVDSLESRQIYTSD